MLRVKICGLSEPATLAAAIDAGASHVGLVHFPASPRHLDVAQMAALAARVPTGVKVVGVFVAPDDALLDRVLAEARIDVVQLHHAAPDRAAAVRLRTGRETWAALPVRTAADLAAAGSYRDAVDRLIYDAKTPAGALPGGMGVRFDWQLLQGFAHPLPWALSGGLDTVCLAEAVRTTHTAMVDVSSGVEGAPGVKNVDKIAAFLQAARFL